MPRKTVEERIRNLEEKRAKNIGKKVEEFRRRYAAQYDARLDLFREMGLPKTKKEKWRESEDMRSLNSMMDEAHTRYMFYRKRYYIHMGMIPEDAEEKANDGYMRYRHGWLRSVGG